MIRIAFNGGMLGERHVGLGKYAFEFLRHFRSKDFEVVVFLRKRSDGQGLEDLSGISLSVIRQPYSTGNSFVDHRLWEFEMFRKAKQGPFDVLHSPYFVCSPYSQKSHIVTVADTVQFIYPRYITSWPRSIYWKYNSRRLRGVQHIITLSEHSKKDIVRLFGKAETTVEVIYPAVSEQYQPNADSSRLRAIKLKYRLPERYILYVGGYDFRKNVERLIVAFHTFAKKHATDGCMLVLAGTQPVPIPGLVPDLAGLTHRLGLSDHVRYTGSIAEEDLPLIYKLARIFVYPSLYEGFGLPVLEAMSCGTPVLSSNASSIPEIIKRADMLFDPLDPEDISSKMERLWCNNALRGEISRWGLAEAGRFTWHAIGEQITNLYIQTASGVV